VSWPTLSPAPTPALAAKMIARALDGGAKASRVAGDEALRRGPGIAPDAGRPWRGPRAGDPPRLPGPRCGRSESPGPGAGGEVPERLVEQDVRRRRLQGAAPALVVVVSDRPARGRRPGLSPPPGPSEPGHRGNRVLPVLQPRAGPPGGPCPGRRAAPAGRGVCGPTPCSPRSPSPPSPPRANTPAQPGPPPTRSGARSPTTSRRHRPNWPGSGPAGGEDTNTAPNSHTENGGQTTNYGCSTSSDCRVEQTDRLGGLSYSPFVGAAVSDDGR
jgi:hypothetical protein